MAFWSGMFLGVAVGAFLIFFVLRPKQPLKILKEEVIWGEGDFITEYSIAGRAFPKIRYKEGVESIMLFSEYLGRGKGAMYHILGRENILLLHSALADIVNRKKL